MKHKLTIIPAQGQVEVSEGEGEVSLERLQQLVGGYIQLLPAWTTYESAPCIVFCNEEGKLHNLPVNHHANMLHRMEGDFLVGTIVICQGDAEFMKSF